MKNFKTILLINLIAILLAIPTSALANSNYSNSNLISSSNGIEEDEDEDDDDNDETEDKEYEKTEDSDEKEDSIKLLEKYTKRTLKLEEKENKAKEKLAERILKFEEKFAKKEAKCNAIIEKAKSYNFVNEDQTFTEFISLMEESNNTPAEKFAILKICDQLENKFKRAVQAQVLAKYNQGLIPFKDTDDSEWYTPYIAQVKEARINGKAIFEGFKDTNGNPTGEFGPANNFRISELLKIALTLGNHDENEEISDESLAQRKLEKFQNHWAKKYLKKAIKLNLSVLKETNDIDKYATRGQVFQAVVESLGIANQTCDLTKLTYTDLDKNHPNINAACILTEAGIISGSSDGKLLIDAPVNRAEIAKIIKNVISAYKK